MKDKSKFEEIKKPLSINNYFTYTKNDRETSNKNNNFEKDSIIKKIISNADDETYSVSNSEISFNFSRTMSEDLSIHSLRISKESFVDSILTLPSQTYRNYKEEKSSERKETGRMLQIKSPSTSANKDSNRKRGNNTDRISPPNSKSKNKDHNVDFNETDSMVYVNSKRTKPDLTERSILYTPSTICNYYLQSHEVTPNKTITDSNNKKSDRPLVHKFKLNFKNLNLINITNSNNYCNTSNTNSNNYEENITENNENISSSSRFNVHTFDKRTPIKYTKNKMGSADTKSILKEEKSMSHLNPFYIESSPSVVSNHFKKHLNISEIEIEDRSIDINEEMKVENNSRYPFMNDKNSEKKNLNSAFDQIKKMENANKGTPDKAITYNMTNINLNIIRNENFSFDMTNKISNFNSNLIKKITNFESEDTNKNGNGITLKIENFTIHNNSINNKYENGSHSVKNSKINRFEYKPNLLKNAKNPQTNKISTPVNKTLKDDKQYNSLKTKKKTSTADNVISTALPSSNKSIQSASNKFPEVRRFDDVTEYDSNILSNKEKEEKKKKVMNINLSKVNISSLVKPGFNSSKLNKNTKILRSEPLFKRNEQAMSKSPSSLYDKASSYTKPYLTQFENLNKLNTVINNKYKPTSSQISKEKNGLNTVDSKSKLNSDLNKKRMSTSNSNTTAPASFSSTAIKKIINENIMKNNLAHNSKSKKNESEKTYFHQLEEKKLNYNVDSECSIKTTQMSDRIEGKNDSLKIITNFSHYKRSNKDAFDYIPKKVIMKDACLQTSPCRTLEDESNFKSYFKDKEMNETRVDKLDLKLNKEIVFSKLINPKGDDDDDMDLFDD